MWVYYHLLNCFQRSELIILQWTSFSQPSPLGDCFGEKGPKVELGSPSVLLYAHHPIVGISAVAQKTQHPSCEGYADCGLSWPSISSLTDFHWSPGPRLFLSCPIDVDGSRVWFTDLWNYSIIPYLLEAVREGLQVRSTLSVGPPQNWDGRELYWWPNELPSSPPSRIRLTWSDSPSPVRPSV